MKRFTPAQLERGDGQEGRPTLVAVDGKVYDFSGSRRWKRGRHVNRHQGGQDLSAALQAAPHGGEVLERFEPVGILEAAQVEPTRQPPPWIAAVLAQHPHPMTVHFPIALGLLAAILSVASLASDLACLEAASFYNLIAAALAAPAAIGAGLLSWWYNHGGIPTPAIKKKIAGSALLMLLLLLALALRLFAVQQPGTAEPAYLAYLAVLALSAACLPLLGRIGGSISFGDG